MLDVLCLSVALTIGQVGGPAALPPPVGDPPPAPPFVPPPVTASPTPPTVPPPPAGPTNAEPAAATPPASSPPPAPVGDAVAELFTPFRTTALQKEPIGNQPQPLEYVVPLPPPPGSPTPETPVAVAPPPERWFLMRSMQGTWPGYYLEENRTLISGWTQMSYTASTNDISNQPVVWNDRANKFLLQQHWIRLERTVLTSGTLDPTWGYRFDTTIGSDYRFSMMRGLFNSQLLNSTGAQNLYGVDPIQFYGNVYIPTMFQGTDVRAGRLFTPWGFESLEGISTPFLSRSYAFNWSPPFTHMGIMVSPTFNAQWSGRFMLANGNDVFFDAPQEMRFVGALTWTSIDKRNSATFGWTLGRGKFNAGNPFNPATTGEQSEPAGRNNINVLDLVVTHLFNPRWSYAAEMIYGYQSDVPANVPGGIIKENAVSGTAHWGSVAQYLFWNVNSRLTYQTRLEFFDDFEGQRTGFEGLYTAVTTGLVIKPWKSIMIRPELRYDYNGYSRPFEGKHDIFTASSDLIIRW